MEKAKTHYDAKKQQNQELQEQLRDLEQLQKENKELRVEADRLGRELQQAGLKTKEAEQTCHHLTAQVRSLEAQVSICLNRLTSPLSYCTPVPSFLRPPLPLGFLFLNFYLIVFTFSHMCIHCLGHLPPRLPFILLPRLLMQTSNCETWVNSRWQLMP
jgi:hypothetical protein